MNAWDDIALDIVLAMTQEERQLFFIEEDGLEAKHVMESLIWQYEQFTRIVERSRREAQRLTAEYNETKDEDILATIEERADWVQTFSAYKPKLRQEIKQARGKLQWQRKQWTQQAKSLNELNSDDIKQP